MECLEQALKLQVEKRMEADIALTALLKLHLTTITNISNNTTKNNGQPAVMANFFQQVKLLLHQLKQYTTATPTTQDDTNNNVDDVDDLHTTTYHPLSKQFTDFNELLTVFFQETNTTKDNDYEMMDWKDVCCLLMELKLIQA